MCIRDRILTDVEAVTGSPFACVTLDWWPDAKVDWNAYTWNASTITTLKLEDDATHARLAAALKGLGPVALRVGGSLQDLVSYDFEAADGRRPPFDGCPPWSARPADRVGFQGGCLKQSLYERLFQTCLLYTSPSPRDATLSRMPSSA